MACIYLLNGRCEASGHVPGPCTELGMACYCHWHWQARAKAAEKARDPEKQRADRWRHDGVSAVERHIGQWNRGEPLTHAQQREVHLVALGALLMAAAARDADAMVRLHRACGCVVCRAEATAKAAYNVAVDAEVGGD